MKPKYWWYIIGACALLLAFTLYFGFQDYKECAGNPFTYGAKKVSNLDSGNLFCSCSFSNPNYAPFTFNKKEINVIG